MEACQQQGAELMSGADRLTKLTAEIYSQCRLSCEEVYSMREKAQREIDEEKAA